VGDRDDRSDIFRRVFLFDLQQLQEVDRLELAVETIPEDE